MAAEIVDNVLVIAICVPVIVSLLFVLLRMRVEWIRQRRADHE